MPTATARTPVQAVTDGVGLVSVRDRSRSHTPRSISRAATPRTANRTNIANAAVLKERARIARELHDSVSQTLYAISLTASRALMLLEQNRDVAVHPFIEDVLQLATSGQSELRALLADIRSDQVFPGALSDSLSSLASEVRARHGLDIRIAITGETDLSPATKAALVLICREALHNVVKHAHASQVHVVFEVLADELVLLIADDGRGFDPSASRPGHFGLQSMCERAAAVGGELDVTSTPGVGTQIRMTLPKEDR
jgi:signal transduction histidine kinase